MNYFISWVIIYHKHYFVVHFSQIWLVRLPSKLTLHLFSMGPAPTPPLSTFVFSGTTRFQVALVLFLPPAVSSGTHSFLLLEMVFRNQGLSITSGGPRVSQCLTSSLESCQGLGKLRLRNCIS